MIKKHGTSTVGILSPDFFKLASKCGGGRYCFTWPTSLRPDNVNAPDSYGWKFTIGSRCGTRSAVGCRLFIWVEFGYVSSFLFVTWIRF